VLDLSNIDLEEIANALADQTDYEHHWLVNPDTGEITFWTADTGIGGQTPVDLDGLDLVVIGPLPSWVWYQDMADFADGITDERAGRGLARAIQGKGAFRRFKEELHEEYPDLLPAWYAFRDTRAGRRAVQWLADNSVIDGGSADRFLSGHPDPACPEPVAAVTGALCRDLHGGRPRGQFAGGARERHRAASSRSGLTCLL
jgi:Uncharacterised protein family (UPF0158)